MCSSDDNYVEESYQIIDRLLLANGYVEPRKFIEYRAPRQNHLPKLTAMDGDRVPLSLPYMSESINNNIIRYIRSHDIPIRVIFTPGRKLRDIFCCSRPYDRKTCFNRRCQICPRLTDGSDCSTVGVVYRIICKLCNQVYIGETSRSLHERLMEHCRYASCPANYPDEALSHHYLQYHNGVKPDLSFSVLDRVNNTVSRKIREAFYITNQEPEINLKEECTSLERYLIK